MKKIGNNFSFIDFGPFEKVDQYFFKHPKLEEDLFAEIVHHCDLDFEVQEGSAIKVAPNGVRTWRSSSCEELLFIVIQAKAGTLGGDSIQDGIPVKP